MKNFFKIMASMLMIAAFAAVAVSCSKDDDETVTTPPHAASAQTWIFGGLTWSDAIRDPACNKQDFDGGTKEKPLVDGRSYTNDGHTYYYYSGRYVVEHATTLCPSPWRVPSLDDFKAAMDDWNPDQLLALWGLGGLALDGNIKQATTHLYLWTGEISIYDGSANYFYVGYGDPYYDYDNQNALPGFQLRCVK
jgi:hypothetical protein